MHKIDLKNYEIRTDMAIDVLKKDDINIFDSYTKNNVKVSWINLDENNSLNKKEGLYLTLEFDDITDTDYKNQVSEVFLSEFKTFLEKQGYSKIYKTMVIGLGNINSTADSLGPLVSNNIIVTKHLFELTNNVSENLSCVSSFYPGVTGQTGIETFNYINAISKEEKPDLIIIVDALASNSISRVNRSIQVSNAGISPGSGVGNKRKEISKDTLGIPVVSIGVPTVVDAVVIVSDTINYMLKNYAYNKNLTKKNISKFINKGINYLNKDIDINKEDKKTFLGLLGNLDSEDIKNLIFEVLTPIGYNLMVTPKEVDFVIHKLSDIISYGINNSLHKL